MSGRALRYLTQPMRGGFAGSTESRPITLGAGEFSSGTRECGCRSFRRQSYVMIMAVALDWLTTRFANDTLERSCALLLRRGCARHVKDFLFHDRAVQVVDAVTERDLGKRQSHADPICGQVVDVIEINAADREVTKLFNRRGGFDMREDGGLRFERERNKAGKAPSFVLQFAQLAQMIHALGESLDVSVEHGARAPSTHGVPDAMNIEPFRGAFLATANFIAYCGVENFCASAGHRSETGLAQKRKRFVDRHAKDSLCEMTNFNGSESFDMQIRIELAKAS